MSRSANARRKNQANPHENCVSAEHQSTKERALLKKAANDKHEAKQQYIVVRVDRKTTIYKPITPKTKLNGSEIIHKGRI
jgi:hypothetical protein